MTTLENNKIMKLQQEVRELRDFVMGFIPKESFSDYENPKKLKKSFERGLLEYKQGHVSTSL